MPRLSRRGAPRPRIARHDLTVTSVRAPPAEGLAADQPGGEVGLDLVQRDPLLGHRVALADRHGLVVEGVEVDGEAERGADLVLAAVAAPDRAGVVELDVPVL